MINLLHDINETILCESCITGEVQKITVSNGKLESISHSQSKERLLFIGPGLIDLQVNGINGIDFNVESLTVEQVKEATGYLLSKGVTSFFPTVITNSDDTILSILNTIHRACATYEIVNSCIGGIHLEGPFISPQDGARGAHDPQFIKAPDIDLFQKFQNASGGRIKIVTIAPEWRGAVDFIKACRLQGIIVSIGHSLANTNDIDNAVKAGALMSTHLGNGIPLMLQRHPNIIWDQLGADQLYTCLIADGIHLPDSFIKTVIKAKGCKALMVSDATCFAGMPPGEYQTHIGGSVILDNDKRILLKNSGGLLAGAAKNLLENIETLLARNICGIHDGWRMGSEYVSNLLEKHAGVVSYKNDLVIFDVHQDKINIHMVLKNGKVVFTENEEK